MDLRLARAAAAAALAAIALAGCAPAGHPVATFRVVDEEFKVELATPELVEHAEALLAGEEVAGIPVGRVVRDDPGPKIEVCDGLPSFVEEGIVTSPDYCPWGAEIVAID